MSIEEAKCTLRRQASMKLKFGGPVGGPDVRRSKTFVRCFRYGVVEKAADRDVLPVPRPLTRTPTRI